MAIFIHRFFILLFSFTLFDYVYLSETVWFSNYRLEKIGNSETTHRCWLRADKNKQEFWLRKRNPSMIRKGGRLKCAGEEREFGAGGGKEEARPQAEGLLRLMDEPRWLLRVADNSCNFNLILK